MERVSNRIKQQVSMGVESAGDGGEAWHVALVLQSAAAGGSMLLTGATSRGRGNLRVLTYPLYES